MSIDDLKPGPGRDSSEPVPSVLPRLPSPHLPPGVRLDPASMEERIAELERRQQLDARWIETLQDRNAALADRVEKVERACGLGA